MSNDTVNVQRGIIGSGAGDDTYVLSANLIDANAEITISDVEGTNKIQLIGGLTITSSIVAGNTTVLTLSNGAVVTVLGASSMSYEVGGNPLIGTTGDIKDYATFANDVLGVATLPTTGSVDGGTYTVESTTTTPAAPTFSVASADSVTEGETATFTVTLSAAQGTATTVDYTLAGTGGAVLGTDTSAQAATGTLTFAAGETTKTIAVASTFDTLVETGEGVSLTLSAPSTGTELSTTAAAKTVALADPAAPTFTLTSDAVAGAATTEGNTITYTITPSGITDKAYTFTLSTAGNTLSGVAGAAAGADFSPAASTVSFAAGATAAQTVVQTIVADGVTEGLEGYKTSLLDASFTEFASMTGLINDGSVAGTVGTTFTLTTGLDNVPGTAADDTIIGEAASASVGDQVVGGGGNDTFKLFDGAGVADIPTISGVEVFDLVNFTTATDFTPYTDLTTLKLDNATTAQTFTAGAAVNFELKSMADSEAITLVSTATDTTHNIAVTDMGTIAGTGVTVNANGAAVTTINVTATGTVAAGTDSDITLTSTGTETTVNVMGAGDLALTGLAASVVTVNASTATGNLTIASGANTAATSITTGSGGDTVTATAAVDYTINLGAGNDTLITADDVGELTTADTINGGDGTDTLAISSAEAENLDDGDAADIAVLAKVTGFEQLRITDAVAGNINLGNLGYNYLQVTTDNAAARTISGVTSGFTFESRLDAATTNEYVVTMTGATGAGTNSDTINLNLNADLTANDTMRAISFDLAGINIVNISANDRVTTSNPDTDANGEEGYTVDLAGGTAANSANITTVNVTGAQKVSYTVAAETAGLTTFDASAHTGEITFVGTAFAGTQGVVIKGGSKADALTGTALADIIDGGAGNDVIVGGVGADIMTGGAGVDTFTFANTATGLPSATAFDTITDFAKGSDIIDGPSVLTISQSGTATVGVAAINAEGIASFNVADDTMAEMLIAVAAGVEVATATTANDIAIFAFGSDSYVFISDATAGLSTTDVLIKLTGVTGLTDSTITGGDLTIV